MSDAPPSAGFRDGWIRREFDCLPDGASVLVLGRLPRGLTLRETLRLHRVVDAADAADVDGCGRHDLGLITGLASSADAAGVARLLGRLRDVHTDRMLVWQRCLPGLAQNDMLALGFECHRSPDGDAVYLHDRDRFNEKREWNSPEHWANPGNFDRYRW